MRVLRILPNKQVSVNTFMQFSILQIAKYLVIYRQAKQAAGGGELYALSFDILLERRTRWLLVRQLQLDIRALHTLPEMRI